MGKKELSRKEGMMNERNECKRRACAFDSPTRDSCLLGGEIGPTRATIASQ